MIDELIDEEKMKANLRLQQREQLIQEIEKLDSKIALSEKRLKEVELTSTPYPARVHQRNFNFFQKIFFRKKYKDYIAKKQQYDADFKISEEKNELRNKEISTLKTDIKQLNKELLNLKIQLNSFEKFDDENTLNILNDRKKAIKFLVEKNPNLQSDLTFIKEIVSLDYQNLQYDKTDNPELYQMVIQQLIDDHKLGEGTYKYNPIDNPTIVSLLEKYYDINPDEKISGKYRIPIKYLYELIRVKLSCIGSTLDDCYPCFTDPIDTYYSNNNKFPQEYGEKFQELWEDKSFRLGVHGFKKNKGPEYWQTQMEEIFKHGLRTSAQQKGETDLGFMSYVQGYSEEAAFLDFFDYSYQMGGFILFALPEECFDENSKKPIWGGNNPKAIGEEYILPEYILGFVPQDGIKGTEEYFDNRHIIFNNEKNREKYKYFFENGVEGKLMDCEDKDVYLK